jgi:hypothetical protein
MGKDKWAEVIKYLRTSNRDPKKTLKLLKGNEKGHQSNYNINRSSYTLNIIAAITQKTLDPKNKNKNLSRVIRDWVKSEDFENFYNLLRADEGKKYVKANDTEHKKYTKQIKDLWYSKTKEVLKWKKYFKETGGYFIVNNPTEALDKSQGKSVISSSLKPKNKRS